MIRRTQDKQRKAPLPGSQSPSPTGLPDMIFMTRLPLPNPDLLAMSRRLSPFPIFFFSLWCERAELFPFSGRPVSCFQHLFAYFGSRRWCCARLVEIDTVEVPRNVGKKFSHSPAGFRIRRIRVQSTLEYLCMYQMRVVKRTGGLPHMICCSSLKCTLGMYLLYPKVRVPRSIARCRPLK